MQTLYYVGIVYTLNGMCLLFYLFFIIFTMCFSYIDLVMCVPDQFSCPCIFDFVVIVGGLYLILPVALDTVQIYNDT